MRAHGDGVTGRAVAHAGPREHPHAVLRPPLQLVEHEGGVVQLDGGRLRVAAAALHEVQLVVHDAAVAALGGRGEPRHAHRGRGQRLAGHVARGRAGHCSKHAVSEVLPPLPLAPPSPKSNLSKPE